MTGRAAPLRNSATQGRGGREHPVIRAKTWHAQRQSCARPDDAVARAADRRNQRNRFRFWSNASSVGMPGPGEYALRLFDDDAAVESMLELVRPLLCLADPPFRKDPDRSDIGERLDETYVLLFEEPGVSR